MRMWPPSCGRDDCVSHVARLGLCICPSFFDGPGFHLIEMNPQCPEHVRESHRDIERTRPAMEWTSRMLGESRDV